MSIAYELSEENTRKLREKAEKLGLSPRELLEAGIEDFLSQPEDEFKKALERTLDKNSELYDRLS